MHFYRKDGSAMHTIIGANGKERTTSIRDARKLGLFPSVTTIMDVGAKDALMQYFTQELLKACMAQPFHPDEWETDQYKKQMIAKMKEKGKKAAERGTEIHNELDEYFKGEVITAKNTEYVMPAVCLIKETFGLDGWTSEQSFAHESGFAGCVDLHSKERHIIIDFKTKDKEGLEGVTQYDDHRIQLAAYQIGLGMRSDCRRFNLFISTHKATPGQCSLIECTEFVRYADMFSHLHSFWMLKNKYNPSKGAIK